MLFLRDFHGQVISLQDQILLILLVIELLDTSRFHSASTDFWLSHFW
jgi:hypothetical protein